MTDTVNRDASYGGSYTEHYQGPIVRVNPTELSIRDAEYYNQLYVLGGKRRSNLIAGNRAGLGMSGKLLYFSHCIILSELTTT